MRHRAGSHTRAALAAGGARIAVARGALPGTEGPSPPGRLKSTSACGRSQRQSVMGGIEAGNANAAPIKPLCPPPGTVDERCARLVKASDARLNVPRTLGIIRAPRRKGEGSAMKCSACGAAMHLIQLVLDDTMRHARACARADRVPYSKRRGRKRAVGSSEIDVNLVPPASDERASTPPSAFPRFAALPTRGASHDFTRHSQFRGGRSARPLVSGLCPCFGDLVGTDRCNWGGGCYRSKSMVGRT
jgi:hypothetical protein